jgi:hypothetical protein
MAGGRATVVQFVDISEERVMKLPGIPRPRLQVIVSNLYDTLRALHGDLRPDAVRSVGIIEPHIDLRVLSLLLPADVIELLGLEKVGGGRLSPVDFRIGEESCTVEPFRTDGNRVVIGHIPLTALWLKLDEDGDLVPDPLCTR